MTGREIWKFKVDDHPYATSTGSPTVHDGRVYVTTSGVGEEGQGGRVGYECCTFRGSVTALDASTGKVIWKSYTITEAPKPRAKNKAGLQTWGPAGGGIWSAPDDRRGATGDLRRHGQRLRRPAAAHDRCRAGARHRQRKDPVVVSAAGQRRVGGRVRPRRQRGQSRTARPRWGRTTTSPCRRCWPSGPTARTCSSSSRSRGWRTPSIPTSRVRSCGRYRTSQGASLGGQWGAAVDDRQAYFGVVRAERQAACVR